MVIINKYCSVFSKLNMYSYLALMNIDNIYFEF